MKSKLVLVRSCFDGGEEVVGELLDMLGDPADPKKPLVIEPLDVIKRIDGYVLSIIVGRGIRRR